MSKNPKWSRRRHQLSLSNFGELALIVLISFLLSFSFMIDNKKTVAFSQLFLQGSASWFLRMFTISQRKFLPAHSEV